MIQEGTLLAWDASLGEYQAVVLSNGALPEGTQIIENEIVASDGAVLYRFDDDTGVWAEPALTLTAERFDAMSDDEIRAAAPAVNASEYGLPAELTLTPSEIIRGGEGGNYRKLARWNGRNETILRQVDTTAIIIRW
jgi:hypothetical protein